MAASITQTSPPVLSSATGRTYSTTASVLFIYALLVLLLWAPFGPRNGMPYETQFAYQSQSSSVWDGFFFVDPLRVYTNVFYQLGFLVSGLVGMPGSFVGYQLVYAALWWGQSGIVYFAARRLWPRYPLFNFFLGALLMLHSSDHSLNWVGQMNQLGMIFWMLASFYFVIRMLQAKGWIGGIAALIPAGFLAYLSLWSYESQLFTVAAVPVILLFVFGWRLKNIMMTAAYGSVPGAYALLNYLRYTREQGSYQQSVLRPDFKISVLLSDLMFNMKASLACWNWPMHQARHSAATAAELGAGAAVVMAGGVLFLYRLNRRPAVNIGAESAEPVDSVELVDSHALAPRPLPAMLILMVGLGLMALSFPAYLILTSARALWRTQYLSGLGAALTVAALVAIVGLRRPRWTVCAMLVVGAIWAYFGVYASYDIAAFHYRIWENHRRTIAAILHTAPSVKDDTIIVLTNVPKTEGTARDPFGDVMWLDMALRLAYPNKQTDGVYYYPDGTPCHSFDFTVDGDQWNWHGHGYPPLVRQESFKNTLILRMEGDRANIQFKVPSYVTTSPAALAVYRPRNVILKEPVAKMAFNRYLRHDSGYNAPRDAVRKAVPTSGTATTGG